MNTTLNTAEAKRARITAWMATAIGILDAKERGLVQISNQTALRNWTCREALYDFAQQASQSNPILVRLDERRAALFGMPNKTNAKANAKKEAAATKKLAQTA